MPPRSFLPPTQEDADTAFELYTAAVGRVAAAWNYLHEQMEALFLRVVGGRDYRITDAVWHSSFSDRAQRQMLEAAIRASDGHPAWKQLPNNAKDDLLWLMNRANYLSDKRDEAVHAPCSIFLTTADGTEVISNYSSQHRRAKSLAGKEILVEFDWLERYIGELSEFTHRAWIVMGSGHVAGNASWPQKPRVPDRRPKKSLQDRPRRRPPK
jgi:hypothetical protein